MNKGTKVILLFTALFLWLVETVKAKMLPQNFAVLNYTQVMFEFDQIPGATHYMVWIEQTNGSKNNKGIGVQTTTLAALVTQGFQFGNEYSWKVDAWDKKRIIHTTPLNYFSIARPEKVNTDFVRFNVEKAEPNAFHNDLLFIDHLGILINRKGEPVWFFPEEKLRSTPDEFNYRAMRFTRDGTFTFIYNGRALERDINGEALWEAPANTALSGAETESYHHDFQKMDDGTYLACGYHFSNEPHYFNENITARVRYNTLLRFNRENELVWFWNEKDHVDRSVVYRNYSSTETEIPGTHMNGFSIYPPDSAIFLSFRNTSEIMKVDLKQSGKVVYTWKGPFSRKTDNRGIYFISQHGPFITPEGNMVVYNNNVVPEKDPGKIYNPKILVVSNPGKNKLSDKVWEYDIVWDKRPEGVQAKEGYALLLPNKNYLVNTGGAERTFEVTPQKKVVWDCTYEKYDAATQTWKPFNNYRCGYIQSLYPRYFTIEQAYRGSKVVHGTVKINNNGTESDRYVVEVSGSSGKIWFKKVIALKPNATQTVNWLQQQKPGIYREAGLSIKIWPEGSMHLARIVQNFSLK